MRVFEQLLFDQTISGTSDTWYTPDEYSDLLGAADVLELAVHTTNVTGTAEATVTMQHSADGRHWNDIGDVHSGSISSNRVSRGSAGLNPANLSLVRLKVTLGGTDPQCRMKLYAMGRVT